MNDDQIAIIEKESLPTTSQSHFSPTIYDERWVDALNSRMQMIHKACAKVLQADEGEGENKKEGDYGTIPGCGSRKVLKKSGAEKLLALLFLSHDTSRVQITDLGNGHREYVTTCIITDPSGRILCAYKGSCSTMESKYRWRDAKRKCPCCGKETIIKGKEEYGGGWLCYKKQGGCGSKFDEDDSAIVEQKVGRIENPDIADVYNTVLKISEKRSLVGSAIGVTGTGNLFTQDLDDIPELVQPTPPPKKNEPPQPIERPHKYDGKRFMGSIPKEERASFWATCVKSCQAIADGEYILTSKPVLGMEAYLVGAQPENPSLPFNDDLPAWEEEGEKKETPQETVERLKKKAAKKQEVIEHGTN